MHIPDAATTAGSSAVPVERAEHTGVIRLPLMLLAACVSALGMLPVAWNARDWISADGIAYLEVAANAIRLGPQVLFLNGYWSPAYPALLAAMLKLIHPSLASELALVHVVDWLICVATVAAFTWFLFNILEWIQSAHGDTLLGGRTGFCTILVFAYTLLFVANLDSSLWYVGPNILLECAVYLAAGMCVRLSLKNVRLIHYVLLGIILAFGYSVKAVLFPLSLLLLAILFIRPVAYTGGRKGILIAMAAFLLAVSPLMATLSYGKGRLTFGDTGRLNYAWYVNNVPRSILWRTHQASTTIFLHPPVRVSADPSILQFEGPGAVASSHPFWYDPSWWYDGLGSHFNFRQQMAQIFRSLGIGPKVMVEGNSVFQLAERWMPVWAGLAALVIFGFRSPAAYPGIKTHIWLLVWPTAAICSFACVLLLYRYVVAFIVLGLLSAFATAWIVVKPERWIGITLTVAAGLILAYVPDFARDVAQNQRRSAAFSNLAVARKLRSLGIRQGDKLASIDFAEGAYYARLVGARFTQEIRADDLNALSKIPEAEVQQVFATLRANGARALFSTWRQGFDNDSGWVLVTEHIYVRMLD